MLTGGGLFFSILQSRGWILARLAKAACPLGCGFEPPCELAFFLPAEPLLTIRRHYAKNLSNSPWCKSGFVSKNI
jgi:hypothetical protein